MKKTLTLEQFRKSRVEMTPEQYCSIYLTIEETKDNFVEGVLKVHVYKGGLYIEEHDNGFYVTYGNGRSFTPDLEHSENVFWEEFACGEFNYLTEEQTEKLDEIKSLINVLHISALHLSDRWSEMQDEDLDELLCVKFPFHKSFCDIVVDIKSWEKSLEQ